jgi:hypothetical protein
VRAGVLSWCVLTEELTQLLGVCAVTGSVCFRAVQLNSFIGGRAKHAHEMQGEESPLFVSYYQDHIQAAKAGTYS